MSHGAGYFSSSELVLCSSSTINDMYGGKLSYLQIVVMFLKFGPKWDEVTEE
jgi:hypothetical protein